MITQITSQNKDEYDKLFEEAVEALKKTGNQYELMTNLDAETFAEGQYFIEDPNNSGEYIPAQGSFIAGTNYYQQLLPDTISTLPQYFHYLQQLVDLNTKFVILPLDEEYFEINANSRTIKVPEDFRKNGVGVQGDHGAEVLYFKINRFFDHMDFGRDDTCIIIQWENSNKQGSSVAFCKDIESDPEYVIFGWELDSDITKAGSLKFSVRILVWDTVNENEVPTEYLYSFSTLTTSVLINPALSLTGDYLQPSKDVVASIKKRINNSPQPQGVLTLKTPTFAYPVTEEEVEIDLDATENGYQKTLKACAYPNPQGLVNYVWEKDNSRFTNKASVKYVELTNVADYNENITYYILIGEDKYQVCPLSSKDELITYTPEDGSPSYVTNDDGKRLYYKEGQCIIETAGKYTVLAYCSGGNFATSATTPCLTTWVVPGPERIVFIRDIEDSKFIYPDETTMKFNISDVASIVANNENYTGFKTKWYKGNEELSAYKNMRTLSINAETATEGAYFVNIRGTKNNTDNTAEESGTKEYVLLLKAQTPTPYVKVNQNVLTKYEGKLNDVFVVGHGVEGQIDTYENYKYEWYRLLNTDAFRDVSTAINSETATVTSIDGIITKYLTELDEEGSAQAEKLTETSNSLTINKTGYYVCRVTNIYGDINNQATCYTPVYTVIG